MQDSTDRLVHSEACERNKQPIRQVLETVLEPQAEVLEVGSGTGQHIVYFGTCFPAVHWQPADTGDYLACLRARLHAEAPPNVAPAVELDVRMDPWPVGEYDVVFSANTLHFMAAECVEHFFRGVRSALRPDGALAVYGPFNYGGSFTSPSNARFDQWLRESSADRAIRDFEHVDTLAAGAGLELQDDIEMPANNRMLIWRRCASGM